MIFWSDDKFEIILQKIWHFMRTQTEITWGLSFSELKLNGMLSYVTEV